MSQLFEKKMKFRGDKKRHINFPYFLARAKRLNKLFIRGVYIVIQLKNINVSYFGHNALSDITTTIPTGQSIGIIGPNGAGKSTLLKSMLGVIKKDSGEVYINDQPISGFKKKIAYVAQRSEIDLTFPITVFDTVLTGTYPSLKLFVFPGRKEKERAKQALEKVGLSNLAKKQIGNLSGGQLQRVFIARALAQDADYYFLDEPFVGIDMVSEKIIIDILNELKAQGKTVLTVHHDLHKVVDYFDHLVILNKKLIVSDQIDKAFTVKFIQEAYGDSLGDIVIKGVEG